MARARLSRPEQRRATFTGRSLVGSLPPPRCAAPSLVTPVSQSLALGTAGYRGHTRDAVVAASRLLALSPGILLLPTDNRKPTHTTSRLLQRRAVFTEGMSKSEYYRTKSGMATLAFIEILNVFSPVNIYIYI